MNIRPLALSAFAIVCVGAPLAAQTTGSNASADSNPRRLFPQSAEITSATQGRLCRLPLSAEVLAETRADLSDLRVLEGQDATEVPYLIDTLVRWPSDALPPAVTVVPQQMRRRSSGLEKTEELVFTLPETPLPEGSTWVLTVGSSQGPFVRDYVLSADGNELGRGSVFQLDAPFRAQLDVALPGAAPGRSYGLLMTGQGQYVEPVLILRATAMSDRSADLRTALTVVERTETEDSTILEVVRPSGIVPTHLEFETTSAFFARSVRVFDSREGRGEAQVGEGEIFRAPEVHADSLSVRLGRSEGTHLRIEIDRGGSPPLVGLGVTARTEAPALFFECRAEQRLYFGAGRARRPRYDVQRFSGTTLGEAMARGGVPTASIGAIEPNPEFDEGPALSFLMRPGRQVERGQFQRVAPLTVAGARDGVSRLQPNASLLVSATPELHDVRVVDSEGRQWPYVRAPERTETSVPMTVTRTQTPEGTRYVLAYEAGALPLSRLRITTSAPYVRRMYEVQVLDAEDRRAGPSSRGELRRDPDDAGAMEIPLSERVAPSIALTVVDGNDAPLELRVEGVVEAPVLYLLAPDGGYEVLSGAEVPPASYEVSQALPLILATAVVDARLGESVTNPAFAPPPIPSRFTTQQIMVWVVLVLAVLVLGFLTFRVSREPAVAEAAAAAPNAAAAPVPEGDPEGVPVPMPQPDPESVPVPEHDPEGVPVPVPVPERENGEDRSDDEDNDDDDEDEDEDPR